MSSKVMSQHPAVNAITREQRPQRTNGIDHVHVHDPDPGLVHELHPDRGPDHDHEHHHRDDDVSPAESADSRLVKDQHRANDDDHVDQDQRIRWQSRSPFTVSLLIVDEVHRLMSLWVEVVAVAVEDHVEDVVVVVVAAGLVIVEQNENVQPGPDPVLLVVGAEQVAVEIVVPGVAVAVVAGDVVPDGLVPGHE